MLAGILIIVIFLIMAVSMVTKKMPTLLALPLMAILIGFVTAFANHLPWQVQEGNSIFKFIFGTIITEGAARLAQAMMFAIFGAILSQVVLKSGIAERIIKLAAEMSGDKKILVAIFLVLATAVVFTSLTGLGAVIMIGTLVLPILIGSGISPIFAGALLLFGISLGGVFNAAMWGFYTDALKLDLSVVKQFALSYGIILSIMTLIFLLFENFTFKNFKSFLKFIFARLIWIIIFVVFGTALCVVVKIGIVARVIKFSYKIILSLNNISMTPFFHNFATFITKNPIAITCETILGLIIILYLFKKWSKVAPVISLLTPIIPVFLIILPWTKWPIIPAFIVAILYGVLTTTSRKAIHTLTASIIEGLKDMAPVIGLFMGIGMVLNAVMDPLTSNIMQPFIKAIIPHSSIGYLLFFVILAPLALYRGPLNLYGLGCGIAALLMGTGTLSAVAVMGAFLATGQIQGICDPTNTHNVWIAQFIKTTPEDLLRKTILYVWVFVLLALTYSVFIGKVI